MWINLKHTEKKNKTWFKSHTEKKNNVGYKIYLFLKKTSVYVRATIYQCTTHKICIGMLAIYIYKPKIVWIWYGSNGWLFLFDLQHWILT